MRKIRDLALINFHHLEDGASRSMQLCHRSNVRFLEKNLTAQLTVHRVFYLIVGTECILSYKYALVHEPTKNAYVS